MKFVLESLAPKKIRLTLAAIIIVFIMKHKKNLNNYGFSTVKISNTNRDSMLPS